MTPRSLKRGNAATAEHNSGNPSKVIPDLLCSSLTLTCRQIFKGGKLVGRCSLNRVAIRKLSTLCTQLKCWAMCLVLLDWIGPVFVVLTGLPGNNSPQNGVARPDKLWRYLLRVWFCSPPAIRLFPGCGRNPGNNFLFGYG